MTYDSIGIIGAGQMGAGIAQSAAQAGVTCLVTDLDRDCLDRGRSAVDKSLQRFVKSGKLTPDEMKQIASRIHWSVELAEQRGRSFVIEAVPEDESLKNTVLKNLDAECDAQTVIATNTSSLSITRLAANLSRPDRFIGMHFMNPVPLMPLVEVIRGAATSQATCDAVEALAERLGKTTTLSADYPGFISNRILMPMINEAFFALMEGVGTAEDIDTTMTLGAGHPMGPLALADLIGLDTCLAIMEILHAQLGDSKYRPCPLLRRYVAAAWLGRKSDRGVFTYGS